MRSPSADSIDRLYRELPGILTRSGFEQIALHDETAGPGTRSSSAFVMDVLEVDIDVTRGPAVSVSAHDGLISADSLGWRAYFGPNTPVEVVTAAVLAARVVETRAEIVASIQRQQGVPAVRTRHASLRVAIQSEESERREPCHLPDSCFT
jgi:hypothetical protein